MQLTWGVGGTVTPVLFTWLLGSGTFTIWAVLGAVGVAGALYAVGLPRVLPVAGVRVTNGGTGELGPAGTLDSDERAP